MVVTQRKMKQVAIFAVFVLLGESFGDDGDRVMGDGRFHRGAPSDPRFKPIQAWDPSRHLRAASNVIYSRLIRYGRTCNKFSDCDLA